MNQPDRRYVPRTPGERGLAEIGRLPAPRIPDENEGDLLRRLLTGLIEWEHNDHEAHPMREVPAAVGALRPSVSGDGREWQEQQILKLGKRLGYEMLGVVDLDQMPDILPAVRGLDLDAVIIPGGEHMDIGRVAPAVEVVTVKPEARYIGAHSEML